MTARETPHEQGDSAGSPAAAPARATSLTIWHHHWSHQTGISAAILSFRVRPDFLRKVTWSSETIQGPCLTHQARLRVCEARARSHGTGTGRERRKCLGNPRLKPAARPSRISSWRVLPSDARKLRNLPTLIPLLHVSPPDSSNFCPRQRGREGRFTEGVGSDSGPKHHPICAKMALVFCFLQ